MEYLRELKLLRDRLARGGEPPGPGEITTHQLRGYQCALLSGTGKGTLAKPFAAGTVAKIGAVLRTFFRFLVEEGRLAADPTLRLERPKVPKRPPGHVLEEEEMERLLAAPDRTTPVGMRDRAVLELLYATGLRRHEVMALDLGDLDRKSRELVVRAGKGEKARIVPLTRSAIEHVLAYLERARPALATKHPDSFLALFLTTWGRRFNMTSLLRILRSVQADAGVSGRVTPHCFRRTFATALLKGGVSLRHIQVLLGHANLNTTAVYLKLDTKELRRELLLKHPRERMNP